MTFNSDLKRIYKRIKEEWQNNQEPTFKEVNQWLKYSYIQGRIAMGENPNEYVIEE